MSATPSLSSETMVQERDRFVERLLESVSGVFTILSLYLGNRLSF